MSTHLGFFQGTSESGKLWNSWPYLNDRCIYKEELLFLRRRQSELWVYRFCLFQGLASTCTDSCHISFYLLYTKSSEFFVRMTCVCSFFFFLSCGTVFNFQFKIKQVLKCNTRYPTVAWMHAKYKNLNLFEVLCVGCIVQVFAFLFDRLLCI